MRTALTAALLAAACALSTARAQAYEEGQVWTYKTRPGEEGSTLLINKVERNTLGVVYHLSVRGVSVKNRRAPDGVTRELPHLPVGEPTLRASCVELVGKSQPNPAFAAGHAEWTRAYEQGRAGYFNTPVAEIVGLIESMTGK